MEIKSEKMLKSLEFFFQSYNKCFISEFFFILVKSYSILSVDFFSFLRSLLLITLSLEKVLNFGSKKLNKPCCVYFMLLFFF